MLVFLSCDFTTKCDPRVSVFRIEDTHYICTRFLQVGLCVVMSMFGWYMLWQVLLAITK
jgi:hypothetical protein